MSVCCECYGSGRRLCDGLITHLEESYRVRCVWVWSRSLDGEEALSHYRVSKEKQVMYKIGASTSTTEVNHKTNNYSLQLISNKVQQTYFPVAWVINIVTDILFYLVKHVILTDSPYTTFRTSHRYNFYSRRLMYSDVLCTILYMLMTSPCTPLHMLSPGSFLVTAINP